MGDMFTIIGGDGKEYGPVAANQIREWIAAGRANLDTKAKVAGSDEWRRLGDYAEFGGQPSSPPPLPSTMPDLPSYPPYSAEHPFGTPTRAAASTVATNNLGDRGDRLLAQLLDNVFWLVSVMPGGFLIAFAVIRAFFGKGGSVETLASSSGFIAGSMTLCAGAGALLAVQLWMLVTRGQTLGKRCLGLRIVNFDNEANPGLVKAFLLRALVPAFIGAVPYLGFLFAITDCCFIFRQDRRCIHDIIAGTKVIKA